MFGSAAMTVAATADPSGRKCWSIPSLRPSMSGFPMAGACSPRGVSSLRAASDVSSVFSAFVSSVISSSYLCLKLDLDVDARRKVELHERVDRLLRWVVDVDEPLVGPDLELIARVLVDERAADDGELLDAGGQRNRPGHGRPRPLRRLDDLRGGLVDELVVVGLEPDPDPLLCHLFDDLRHDARTDGLAALADREPKALFEGDRRDEGDREVRVVPGHDHLDALLELGRARHVRGADVELWAVAVEERRMPAAFLLGEDVDLGGELRVRLHGPGLRDDLAALDVLALDPAQEEPDVVTGLALVEELAEHLDAGHDDLAGVADAEDLDLFANLYDPALDPAGGDGAAALDPEHIFDRHE